MLRKALTKRARAAAAAAPAPGPSATFSRLYTRAAHRKGTHGGEHNVEIIPPKYPPPLRSKPVRFLNPWVDLANTTDDDVLAFKVESVTRTFGVVAALMCSLSAAAIFVTPDADEEHRQNSDGPGDGKRQSSSGCLDEKGDGVGTNGGGSSRSATGILDNIVPPDHIAGTSLLVSWGVPPKRLSDVYAASCAGSFYSSVCAMGLSAVTNAWLACTPPGGTRYFVRYNSLIICAVPGFLALSTGLAGIALFIGLDRSRGTPVSYIGLAGTGLGGILIGSATARGMICTYRLLTPLVKSL